MTEDRGRYLKRRSAIVVELKKVLNESQDLLREARAARALAKLHRAARRPSSSR